MIINRRQRFKCQSIAANSVQRALGAKRLAFVTTGFCQVYNLSMVVLVKRDILGQVVHKHLANMLIGLMPSQKPKAAKNPSCVTIDHKTGPVCCIQENRVRRFWANAMQCKQTVPCCYDLSSARSHNVSAPVIDQICRQRLNPMSLLSEKPRGTNQPFEFLERGIV